MVNLGPPPPGTWRRNDDGVVPSAPAREIKAWESLPLPRDLEYLTKQPARPFALTADSFVQDNLTVLLFTSPVPSHPSTWLLEKVYGSIRVHLPNVRIVVLADGVNGDEPGPYVEFKDNVRKLGYELAEFKGWRYQTLMLRDFLPEVKTSLVMIGEHDWGLRRLFIDWRGI